jgi:hypothetical protein
MHVPRALHLSRKAVHTNKDMEVQVTFGFKQIVFLLFLAVLLIAGLGLGAFLLGQQNALRLANQVGGPSPTGYTVQATPLAGGVQATLPRAMTATPKPVQTEEIIYTDAQATALAQQQAGQVDTTIPFEIRSLFFTPGKVNLSGSVTYASYSGEINLTGTPYVESGRLKIKVDSVTIAGQSLPGANYADIETELNAMFKRYFADRSEEHTSELQSPHD